MSSHQDSQVGINRSQAGVQIAIQQSSSGNSLTQRIRQLLEEQSLFNKKIDILNGIFSSLVVIQYIHSTYESSIYESGAWPVLNLLFHTFFCFEWVLRVVSSKDISSYLLSWESIADIVSNLPFFILKIAYSDFSNEHYDDLNQVLINMLSLTRIMRLQRLLFHVENDILKQLFRIVLAALSMVIFSAGILQFTQRLLNPTQVATYSGLPLELKDLPFHYYVYFVMTTISTLGYDNPFNNSTIRIQIIILLVFSIIVVPQQSSKLINLLSKKSFFARRSYKVSQSFK